MIFQVNESFSFLLRHFHLWDEFEFVRCCAQKIIFLICATTSLAHKRVRKTTFLRIALVKEKFLFWVKHFKIVFWVIWADLMCVLAMRCDLSYFWEELKQQKIRIVIILCDATNSRQRKENLYTLGKWVFLYEAARRLPIKVLPLWYDFNYMICSQKMIHILINFELERSGAYRMTTYSHDSSKNPKSRNFPMK